MAGATPSDDDGGYADAYADEEDASRPATARSAGDEYDDDDDDTELAEMFAKVQSIQQREGIQVKPAAETRRAPPHSRLEVTIPDRIESKRSDTILNSSSSSARSRAASPIAPGLAATKSPDGITTISRKTLAGGGTQIDLLSGVKKPVLFQERLLQTVKQQPQVLERLTQKVVAAAPAVIAVREKRIDHLSKPKTGDANRMFALDDEQKYCRFRVKKKKYDASGRDAHDDGDTSGHDRTSDFLARMEATERNRQKKLEMTRGEKEYLANLNKKVCLKCDVPQSYTEYRDKKKRCQTCGSEFRVPQAWGDIGAEFINRISDDSKTRDERKEQIRTRVIQTEANSGRVPKSATQHYYEKSLQQRNDNKTFLDRNYSTTASCPTSNLNAITAKTKRAQLQLQQQLQAHRANSLADA